MIKNIEELNETIKDYSEEDKKIAIDLIKPFFDFTDFMLKEYGKTVDDVENESAKYSEEVLPEYLAEMKTIETNNESSLDFIVGLSGKIYKRYAKNHDYTKSDELEKSLTKYMKFIMKKTLENNNNKDGKQ